MKIYKTIFYCPLILILLSGCSNDASLVIREIPNPFPSNAMFPNLYQNGDELMISYIHSEGDTLDQLYYCQFDGSQFSAPSKIAEGTDWFVNWADIPAIAFVNNSVIASWLDKSANGNYDYDIKMSISKDNGKSWGVPFIPHKDGVAAEHGFVSIEAIKGGKFQAVWLDGRITKVIDKKGKESHGQMTLRSAIIDSDGTMTKEIEIDNRICDCCQTSLKNTEIGTFVVYRDRSNDEIRDNYFSIFDDNEWSEPQAIHHDEWKISGCPVNGPVLESFGKNVSAAWYTETNGLPEVYLANYSSDIQGFEDPVLVSKENVMGRIDLIYLPNGNIMVTWLEDLKNKKAKIQAKIYDNKLKLVESLTLGETSSSRSSGFPKIVKLKNTVLVCYTVTEPEIRLVTKEINSDLLK